METELDIYTLFENMEWPATKQNLMQYACDNGCLDEVYDIIMGIEVTDDYLFSSINDLCSFIGVEGAVIENSSPFDENLIENEPIEE